MAKKDSDQTYIELGIEGLDALFEEGIPEHAVTLVVGSPGSGKSIMGLQSLVHAAENGEDCLYITFEENEEQLLRHTSDFDWDAKPVIEDGSLTVKKYDAFKMADAVETWLRRIEHNKNPFGSSNKPLIFEDIEKAKPDRLVLDSLSAIEYAFQEQDKYFRHYLSQLFEFFREQEIDTFVITETQSLPERITENGQAEFLADGVIIMHRIENSRGVEVYKMRGAGFREKLVPMDIDGLDGILVQPDQSFFSEQLDKMKSGRRF